MLKVSSLMDLNGPIFTEKASMGLIKDSPVYSEKTELLDETQSFFMYIKNLPIVNITQDPLCSRDPLQLVSPENLFLPVSDNFLKKIVSIWRERGFWEAVRATAEERREHLASPLHWTVEQLTMILDIVKRGTLKSESLLYSGVSCISDVVSTRDWNTSLVRCMSWHPQCTHLAIATKDDRIRVFSTTSVGSPTLRHSAQKSVSCLSWRPFVGRELAVACESGVVLWTIELGLTSNALSHAKLLKHRNHSPVTSVAWHPQGDFLVSCSLMDLNMMIWDVSTGAGIPIRKFGGNGLCFTKWSSCGSRLLSATTSTMFRVWNTGKGKPWTSEKWTVPSGRIAAACFGPNLSLLFTSTENPTVVFSLPLREHIFETKNPNITDHISTAIPFIDLSTISYYKNETESVTVGGKVVAMDWDPSGKFLAIIFQDSPYIALFKTKSGATSRIEKVSPGHLIQGFSDEVPNCIQFYQNQKQSEAVVLTIAWSSGRVQHFPITDGTNQPASTNSRAQQADSSFLYRTFSPTFF